MQPGRIGAAAGERLGISERRPGARRVAPGGRGAVSDPGPEGGGIEPVLFGLADRGVERGRALVVPGGPPAARRVEAGHLGIGGRGAQLGHRIRGGLGPALLISSMKRGRPGPP